MTIRRLRPGMHHRERDQTNPEAEDRAAARGQREADDQYGHTRQQAPQMRDGKQQQNGTGDQLAGRVLLELPRETMRIEDRPGDREQRRREHVGPQDDHVIAPEGDERADEKREDEQLEPLEALHRRPETRMQREENDDQPSVLDERETHGPQGAEDGKRVVMRQPPQGARAVTRTSTTSLAATCSPRCPPVTSCNSGIDAPTRTAARTGDANTTKVTASPTGSMISSSRGTGA